MFKVEQRIKLTMDVSPSLRPEVSTLLKKGSEGVFKEYMSTNICRISVDGYNDDVCVYADEIENI